MFTILLADDDNEFRQEFRMFFDDYRVLEARNGREVLEILGKPHVVDLVILDERMPEMTGTDALAEIKRIQPDLYTIILTGHSSEYVAIKALKAHTDDYFIKSVGIKKLKKIIDNLLTERTYRDGLEGDDTAAKVEKIREYIERNADKVISLADIARVVYLTPKYISRIFKEYTGMTFNQYKLSVKVKLAKKFLLDSTRGVNQIANELGYKNAESFIRIFKKEEACTPGEYRERHRNE